MLLNKPIKKGDIVTVKLSTGEELVARFEHQDTDKLKLVKPSVLTLNPQNGGAMLIPWLMSIDVHDPEPVTVYAGQIVAMSRPQKGLADAYIQNTTGIQTAPDGLKLS